MIASAGEAGFRCETRVLRQCRVEVECALQVERRAKHRRLDDVDALRAIRGGERGGSDVVVARDPFIDSCRRVESIRAFVRSRGIEQRQRGVLAVGNFAISVVLLQKFAETAAKYIPQWEIIDYAHDDKPRHPFSE